MIQTIVQRTASFNVRSSYSGVIKTIPSVVATRIPLPTETRSSLSPLPHSPTTTTTTATIRSFATGSRGSRGYGWYYHYREGKGGRHLQGEYYDRDSIEQCLAWNQTILDLGSQRIYMDIIMEPRRNLNSSSSSSSSNTSSSASSSITNDSTTTSNASSSSSSSSSSLLLMRNNPKKFFTIPPVDTLTGERHRIVIDIASTVLPATCENFINLIQLQNSNPTTDNNDHDNYNNYNYNHNTTTRGYRGTRLYRIEKNVGIYGGDVLTNTGRTGMAYNAIALTKDVSSTDPIPMWHIPGTITMIVPTVNEIDSRFLMCTQHAPHIDGICRPFGMITTESLSILQKWQTNLLTLKGGIPNAFDLYIVDCGILEQNDHKISNNNSHQKNNRKAIRQQQNQQMKQ